MSLLLWKKHWKKLIKIYFYDKIGMMLDMKDSEFDELMTEYLKNLYVPEERLTKVIEDTLEKCFKNKKKKRK